jgi:hypothetical protein
MKTSNLYSIDYRDLLKGLLIAILTPILVIVQNTVATGHLTFNWQQIGMAGVGGFVAYIGKNFFTASTIKTVADSPTLVAKVEAADPALTK